MIKKEISMSILLIFLAFFVSAMVFPGLTQGSVSTEALVDFGDVVTDSPSKITMSITNLEEKTRLRLNFTFAYQGSCRFSVDSQGIYVDPGDTVDVGVIYEPWGLGPCSGYLFIYYSATGIFGSETVSVNARRVEEATIRTITVNGIDTGILDQTYDGQLISERIDDCAANARNHGRFVSCVAHLMNDLKGQGIITDKQMSLIKSHAAQAKFP